MADEAPAVVVIEGDGPAADAGAVVHDEHARVHELERAALHEHIDRRITEAAEFGRSGIETRLDAVEGRLSALAGEVERLAREPETAPADVPAAAADVVEVPADVIEPPTQEEERRPAPHKRRKKRRHSL